VVTEQLDPVGFVAAFGVGQFEETIALLAGLLRRDCTIDGMLSALFGQVAPPAPNLRIRG